MRKNMVGLCADWWAILVKLEAMRDEKLREGEGIEDERKIINKISRDILGVHAGAQMTVYDLTQLEALQIEIIAEELELKIVELDTE